MKLQTVTPKTVSRHVTTLFPFLAIFADIILPKLIYSKLMTYCFLLLIRNDVSLLCSFLIIDVAFTHAGLTIRYRTKACIKVFSYCQVHAMYSLWRG